MGGKSGGGGGGDTTKAKKARRSSTKPKKASSSRKRPNSRPPNVTACVSPIPRGPIPTLILDSGGWTVKHGVVPAADCVGSGSGGGGASVRRKVGSIPNVTAKPRHQLTILVGDEISTVKNQGQLEFARPLERGYVTDIGTQMRVWQRVLDLEGIDCNHAHSGGGVPGVFGLPVKKKRVQPGSASGSCPTPPPPTMNTSSCAVLLLDQPFTPRAITKGLDEVMFRDFGFSKVGRKLVQSMAAERYLLQLVSPKVASRDGVESEGNEFVEKEGGRTNVIDDGTRCCCVVDSGFSLTYVVPTVQARAVDVAIRRVNVGGKLLTNLLKEAVSYRQWNMMDEFPIVNEVKEQLCFVSTDFDAEMCKARAVRQGMRWFDREYILPDFVETFRGTVRLPAALQWKKHQEEEKKQGEAATAGMNMHEIAGGEIDADDGCSNGEADLKGKASEEADSTAVSDENDSDEETDEQRLRRLQKLREQERRRRELEEQERQALSLSVERFAVPEVLFRPSDIGLDQCGLAEAIVQSIEACDPVVRAAMYHNILLTGGNANIPFFKERLETELRALAPSNYSIRIFLPEDPIAYAWEGARLFSTKSTLFEGSFLDRIEWESRKKTGDSQTSIWDGIG